MNDAAMALRDTDTDYDGHVSVDECDN